MQLGRLRDGALGTVQNGQFRRYQGRPDGSCCDLGMTPMFVIVEQRSQPAARTVVFGLTRVRGHVAIRIGDAARRITPGALGAYVTVYEGMADLTGATVSAGKRTFAIGRSG